MVCLNPNLNLGKVAAMRHFQALYPVALKAFELSEEVRGGSLLLRPLAAALMWAGDQAFRAYTEEDARSEVDFWLPAAGVRVRDFNAPGAGAQDSIVPWADIEKLDPELKGKVEALRSELHRAITAVVEEAGPGSPPEGDEDDWGH